MKLENNERRLILNSKLERIKNRESYSICIPVITDLHILPTEPINRNNIMINRGLQVLDEIAELIKINDCTDVVFTGDITDRGFNKGELTYESQIVSKIAEISNMVNGRCYSVVGNHEITYSNNNLFYTFATIDSDIIKEQLVNKKTPSLIYPYIKTPNCIDFGDLKIHLLHYQASGKKYKVLDNKTAYNIGIYHDDLITFESKQELYHHKLGNGIDVVNTDIFENVDWAILGHIHTPLNSFHINNIRNTLIDNPGSLMSRTIAEKHEKVRIPFICANGDGCYQEYIDFYIGSYEESIDKKAVKDQHRVYEMAKIMKKDKERTNWADYDEYISGIGNLEARKYIAASDKPIVLTSQRLKEDYCQKYK